MEQRAEKKIYMEELGKRAVSAKETVAFLNVIQRQEGLILVADALAAQQAYIIEENQKDIMLRCESVFDFFERRHKLLLFILTCYISHSLFENSC